MLKNINWKNIGVIALVGVLVVPIVYGVTKPYFQKIPVIGSYFA